MVLALPLSSRTCSARQHAASSQRPGLSVCHRRPQRTAVLPVASAASLHFPNYTSPSDSDAFNVSPSGPLLPLRPLQQVPCPQVGPDTGFRLGFTNQFMRGNLLGQGSFGTVYLGASRHDPKREVAVKVMSKVRGKLSRDTTLEKVCREVDFLQRLQGCHGVVRLVDVFEEPEDVLVVTELCTGGDLQRLADTYPRISERCLALIATEVLRTIAACNAAGVVHGDVKPANFVLLHPHHNPLFSLDPALAALPWLKAIDFGCSQMVPGPGEHLTKRAGTPVFMAPEIFQRSYGREADVWSAGVLLYQVFCKRFPFWDTYEAAKASRIDDISDAVNGSDIRLAWGPWLDMSSEGLAFIRGLLTRDPADRLTTQAALAHPWLALALADGAPPAAVPPPAAAAVAGVPWVVTPLVATTFCGNNIVRSPAVQRASAAAAAAVAAGVAPAV